MLDRHHEHEAQRPKHATLLLWIGVLSVTAAVVVLWAINAQTIVNDTVRDGGLNEALLIESTKNELQAVLATLESIDSSVSSTTSTPTQEEPPTDEELLALLESIITTSTTSTADEFPTNE